jgi:DNA processing protein
MIGDRDARMILNGLPDIGPVTVSRIRSACGWSPSALLASSREALRARLRGKRADIVAAWQTHFDLEREHALLERWDAEYLIPGDPGWPADLDTLPDAPLGLYCVRRARDWRAGVAIIGTREPTVYGKKVSEQLAYGLVNAGLTVISGLARGVDTYAHRAALDAGGRTVAVLGGALDRLYPPENGELAAGIAANGGIWTEFCFGRGADRQSFPQRNRIVAGMSRAVVVVESGESGGSMITARFAAEQGKPVFAVPGRIDVPSSAGCHRLLRDGAHVCCGVDDILRELALELQPAVSAAAVAAVTNDSPVWQALSHHELAVAEWLRDGEPYHPDQLAEKTGLPVWQLSGALIMLEVKGLARKRPDGCFERGW